MKNLRTAALFITSILLISAVLKVSGQTSPNGVAYIESTNGLKQIVLLEGSQSFRFTIPNGSCYSLSLSLGRIALTDEENPIELAVFDVKTGMPILQVNWQPDWSWSCGFRWINEDNIVLWHSLSPDDNTISTLSISDGTIITPGSYQPPIWPNLPNLDPESGDFVPSPSSDYFLYKRCGEVAPGIAGSLCVDSQGIVIYRLSEGAIIAQLDDTLPTPARPIDAGLFYSWSPSGRYVAYFGINTPLNVYDVQLNRQVDTRFINEYPKPMEGRPLGILWSPNEAKVAIGVTTIDPQTAEYADGIGVVNLATNTFTFLETTRENWTKFSNAWAWTLDGQSILVIRPDNQLAQIGLDGSIQIIADNVIEIYSKYDGISIV